MRDSLIERSMMGRSEIDPVLAEMRRRIESPNGVALFYWNRIKAVKSKD